MKKLTISLFLSLLVTLYGNAQGLFVGSWNGILDVGSQHLSLVFHFSQDEKGETVCLMDSPDQGAKGIPTEILCLKDDSVSVQVPQIWLKFSGRLHGDTLRGVLRQGMQRFPLVLSRGALVRQRSQNPALPLSYQTEEVSFSNPEANAILSGTLSYPTDYKAGQKVPVVLMVTGSGLENRDEEVFDHKPFLVMADYLARHGIASLRYDDRGCGLSTGDPSQSTTQDFAADAACGVDFLRSKAEFQSVGVLGHSEGASIAFMLAAKDKADFVVGMAGIGVKGDSALAAQVNALAALYGQQGIVSAKEYRENVAKMGNPWLDYFIDYDPSSDIQHTTKPVFAANGNKDVQVVSRINLTAIKELLPRNAKNLVKEYPGLNHLMQHCTTGLPEEYAQIDETISPEFLSDLVTWILSLSE